MPCSIKKKKKDFKSSRNSLLRLVLLPDSLLFHGGCLDKELMKILHTGIDVTQLVVSVVGHGWGLKR